MKWIMKQLFNDEYTYLTSDSNSRVIIIVRWIDKWFISIKIKTEITTTRNFYFVFSTW